MWFRTAFFPLPVFLRPPVCTERENDNSSYTEVGWTQWKMSKQGYWSLNLQPFYCCWVSDRRITRQTEKFTFNCSACVSISIWTKTSCGVKWFQLIFVDSSAADANQFQRQCAQDSDKSTGVFVCYFSTRVPSILSRYPPAWNWIMYQDILYEPNTTWHNFRHHCRYHVWTVAFLLRKAVRRHIDHYQR